MQGSNWVNWTFRVNSPSFNIENIEKGVVRYCAFFALEKRVNLNDAKFIIKLKTIEPLKMNDWKEDYLTNQKKIAWVDFAVLNWVDKEYSFELIP